jgi:hypothetical protein
MARRTHSSFFQYSSTNGRGLSLSSQTIFNILYSIKNNNNFDFQFSGVVVTLCGGLVLQYLGLLHVFVCFRKETQTPDQSRQSAVKGLCLHSRYPSVLLLKNMESNISSSFGFIFFAVSPVGSKTVHGTRYRHQYLVYHDYGARLDYS